MAQTYSAESNWCIETIQWRSNYSVWRSTGKDLTIKQSGRKQDSHLTLRKILA